MVLEFLSKWWEEEITLNDLKKLRDYYEGFDDETLHFLMLNNEVKQKSQENTTGMINFSFGSAFLPMMIALIASSAATTGAWVTLIGQFRSLPNSPILSDPDFSLNSLEHSIGDLWGSNFKFILGCFAIYLLIILTVTRRRAMRFRRFLIIKKIIEERGKEKAS
ncbi:hypothetical protein JJB07_02990 [Tumebacillus sp. ITR2]|uniref:DUF1700 domain-containing protein n=1 Tax=Tumebacillus amylolyticus TaxID=2801339 RepID=A0ABS1J5P3_9BACL|nr:hypothetical protein [Tumebacillus amylolyticus]MBL0385606.1 hypothetical protein [Tumebacillus amylolyticus]